MNEMPDLDPTSKNMEQRRSMKFWVDRCHDLENIVNEQKKIIHKIKKQYEDLVNGKNSKAPIGVFCVCCSIPAEIIASCGHYFCVVCTDRYHHEECIECEKFK